MDLKPFDEYVSSLPRKRMSAGVLYRDQDDRILLVETTYKEHWDIPGGVVNENEAPWDTAVREVREEIGITRPLGALLVIDHVHAVDRMPEGLAFIFDGGTITEHEVSGLQLRDGELRAAFLLPLADARSRMKPALAGRLEAALTAARGKGLVFCDDGTPRTEL
nr:NUDIX hydrolase [Amycolatopsis anabasis]